jgi:hypothetical protein
VTPAARVVICAAPLTGCVFKTADEVEALEEERHLRNWGSEVVAWCITEGAAEKARELGWNCIQELKGSLGAEELVDAMCERRALTQIESANGVGS